MANRESSDDGYTHSYSYQREVCELRRLYNLPCKDCRYLERCKTKKRILNRLNNELKRYKTRTP